MGDLSSANLIVTLDQESEQYTKTRKYYIRGEVRPIGMFLSAGSLPFIADPFERDDSSDANNNYEQIIQSVEFGCGNLLKSLPSFDSSSSNQGLASILVAGGHFLCLFAYT